MSDLSTKLYQYVADHFEPEGPTDRGCELMCAAARSFDTQKARIEELEGRIAKYLALANPDGCPSQYCEACSAMLIDAAEGQEPAYIGSTDNYHTGEGPSEGSVDVVESRPRLTIDRASEGQYPFKPCPQCGGSTITCSCRTGTASDRQ